MFFFWVNKFFLEMDNITKKTKVFCLLSSIQFCRAKQLAFCRQRFCIIFVGKFNYMQIDINMQITQTAGDLRTTSLSHITWQNRNTNLFWSMVAFSWFFFTQSTTIMKCIIFLHLDSYIFETFLHFIWGIIQYNSANQDINKCVIFKSGRTILYQTLHLIQLMYLGRF